MGAFLSGLLGAAGADIEQKEQRAYAEGLSERQQKRKMVEYAMQQAVQAGDFADMPYIMGQLDEIGVPSNAPKGVKDPFREMGTKLAQIFKRQKAQQGQAPQGQPQQAQPQVAPQAQPGVAPQGAPQPLGQNMGFPPQTPPMPPTQFGQAPQPQQSPTPPLPIARNWGEVGGRVQQLGQAAEARKAKTGRETFEFEENLQHKHRMEELEVKPGSFKEIPNVKGDDYGHPGEVGTLEVNLKTGEEKFRPTIGKAGASRFKGALEELSEAKRALTDPTASPEDKAAAGLFLQKYAASAQSIDPATAAFIAKLLMQGGPSAVPLGFGAQVRIPVFKELQKQSQKLGMTPQDMVTNWQALQANSKSLANLTRFYDFTESFSKFTGGQLARLNAAAQQTGLVNTRLFNQPISAWKERVKGDPQFSAYLLQLQSSKTELSRILNAPGSQGQIAEGMRKDLDAFMNDSLSPAAIKAVTDQASKDITGRRQAYTAQRQDIMNRIRNGEAETSDVPETPKAQELGETKEYNGHTYTRTAPGQPWTLVR